MNKRLLSISFDHDSAIAYYDGHKIKYLKLERVTAKKHDQFVDCDQIAEKAEYLIGDKIDSVDAICLIDCCRPEYIKTFVKSFSPSSETKLHPIEHHFAHYLSGKLLFGEPDISINVDGAGDNNVFWSVFRQGKKINQGIQDLCNSFTSIGLMIEVVLGFYCGVHPDTNPQDIAGKFMSLQTYGNINDHFLEQLKLNNVTIHNTEKIRSLIVDAEKLYINKLDIGRTIHYYIEHYLLPSFFAEYAHHDEKIIYSGGVAQNIIWNTALKKRFPNLVVYPHCYDAGLCLGGIEYLRELYNIPLIKVNEFPFMSYSEIPDTPTDITIKKAAQLLADNKIIGWYQGASEVGPRALGNRSILMNPAIDNGKNKINTIKKREYYRPFGATVLNEYKDQYFDLGWESPHMLYLAEVKVDNLKSITHIDNTCRIQTLKDENVVYRKLIEEFYKLTGIPILLNTSLNVAGEPIAATFKQAERLFNESSIDAMFIGNKILQR